MPTPPESARPISPEEFQSLLTLAGLDISAEQAPLVMAELALQLNNARLIDAALAGQTPPTGGDFDPAFPQAKGKGRAE